MKDEEKKDNPVENTGDPEPEEKKPEEPAGEDHAEDAPPEAPPAEEKPGAPSSDASQGEENGEGAKPENPDAPPEAPEAEADAQPDEDPPAENASDELLLARAELSAIKSGMSVSVAEDAVVLAMHDLKKDGAVPDQAGLEKALKGVLKRHPEWDAKKQQGTPAGFKVGADGSQNQDGAADDTISRAFGNK